MAVRTREHYVQHVLNGGRNQVSATTSQTCTLEDVDNVVPSRLRMSEHIVRRCPQTPGLTS